MIVIISDEAEADLERIADHIAIDNPARALAFVRELRQNCEKLADMPARFPLVPRYESIGIRRRVYGAYLIFYRINAQTVEILHILHGATDYARILSPDE